MGAPPALPALRRLTLADAVSDPDTLWGFCEELRRSGVLDRLFARFNEAAPSRGFLPQDGHIVDCPFVEVTLNRRRVGRRIP